MKAMGVDCWVPDELAWDEPDESSNSFNTADDPENIRNLLRQQLNQLAELMKQDGYEVIMVDSDRIRIAADDQETDVLYEKVLDFIDKELPRKEIRFKPHCNCLTALPVREGTPIEERARWDENSWKAIRGAGVDFPMKDDPLVWAKCYAKRVIKFHWAVEQSHPCLSSGDIRYCEERLLEPIRRIQKLVDGNSLTRVLQQASEEYAAQARDIWKKTLISFEAVFGEKQKAAGPGPGDEFEAPVIRI